MEIKKHLLYIDGKQATYRPSPNHGGAMAPIYIIIHYTASSSADGAIDWMTSSSSKVSAHLHIDRSGRIVQLVPFNTIAWHAGVSEWKGKKGLNSYSIGIELQNTGIQEYTKAQLDSLASVCSELAHTYPISEILGHSDIAPGRKQDPGPQFPMEWLRSVAWELPEPSVKLVEVLYTTADLNLRDKGSISGRVISVLPKGTEVNVLNQVDGWSNVFICKSKLLGWVSSKYLK